MVLAISLCLVCYTVCVDVVLYAMPRRVFSLEYFVCHAMPLSQIQQQQGLYIYTSREKVIGIKPLSGPYTQVKRLAAIGHYSLVREPSISEDSNLLHAVPRCISMQCCIETTEDRRCTKDTTIFPNLHVASHLMLAAP
ncbi:hypothetical protein F5X97DRAFT_148507 [Nemania serpens]|nr:hypothetical protein F5X97DRAFT_148507 [Nemania serpens]